MFEVLTKICKRTRELSTGLLYMLNAKSQYPSMLVQRTKFLEVGS